MTDTLKIKRSISLFISLSLFLALTYWIVFFIWPKDTLHPIIEYGIFGICRGFGPAISALIAIFYLKGRDGIKQIWNSLILWKIPAGMYVLMIGGTFLLSLLVLLIVYLSGEVSIEFRQLNYLKMVFIFLAMILIDGPLGEEVGWRGFLLPNLFKFVSPVSASIWMGIIGYLWHLPLYATDGIAFTWIALISFLFQIISFSLIMTWFFIKTQYSLFFAILLHAFSNYGVFFSRSLVITYGDTTVDTYARIIIMVFLALLCMVDLGRRGSDIKNASFSKK